MKRCLKIPYIAFLLIISCSTEDPKSPVTGPEEFELTTKIVGAWDVDNTNNHSPEAITQKESDHSCYVFSFVFNADGTFVIGYRYGELSGNYKVIDETTISLNSAGVISEISFANSAILFSADLTGICTKSFQCNLNNFYTSGRCYAFLKCNDQKVWKNVANGTSHYLKFLNYYQGTWFRNFTVEDGRSCYSVDNNQLEEGNLILIKNSGNRLVFIHEKDSGNEIHTYTVNGNGDLELNKETGSGIIKEIYQETNQAELDTHLAFNECGAKTYIPDDVFERNLISLGFDDVMDDYVLTEKIVNIKRLSFFNWDIIDLTGLEDFIALEDLTIQSTDMLEIDLTKNINLKLLFLGSQKLTQVDLTKNTKLKSLYFEYGQINTIDISRNSELRSIEFYSTSISSIDISNNLKLESLTIEGGNLTEIKSVRTENLVRLDLDNQNLGNFDVSNFPNLQELWLQNNGVLSIDVSELSNLKNLELTDNKLEQLDISKNLDVTHLITSNNPDLKCIQLAGVHQERINNAPSWEWVKDEAAEYSLDCGY